MYKQRFYSIISIFLCITILFSYMPLHVFAEENIATDSNATTTYVFDENGNEICSECGNSTFHSEDCSLYEESSDSIYSVEDDTEIICSCPDNVHNEDCYLWEEPVRDECTCGLEVHEETCPLYEVPIIEEYTCTCGSENGIHTMDCVLYKGTDDYESVCLCETDIHVEGCPLYEGIIDEPVCTCNTEDNVHEIGCDLYVEVEPTCNCETDDAHKKDCPLYVAPEINFSYLISIDTLFDLYEALYNQYEVIATFEKLEIELLLLHVEELYNLVEEPTEEDTLQFDYLYNIVNSYIIVICESCGQEDGIHLDDCEFWVCDECGQNEHTEDCSKHIKIDVVCSECNEKDGVHLDTCSKYVISNVLCNECGEKDGLHLESCSKYVTVCEECGQKGDAHLETCTLYICSECNHNKHIRGCSLYVLTENKTQN